MEQFGHQGHLLFLLCHLLLGGKGPLAFENSAQGRSWSRAKAAEASPPPTPSSSESRRSSQNQGGPVSGTQRRGTGNVTAKEEAAETAAPTDPPFCHPHSCRGCAGRPGPGSPAGAGRGPCLPDKVPGSGLRRRVGAPPPPGRAPRPSQPRRRRACSRVSRARAGKVPATSRGGAGPGPREPGLRRPAVRQSGLLGAPTSRPGPRPPPPRTRFVRRGGEERPTGFGPRPPPQAQRARGRRSGGRGPAGRSPDRAGAAGRGPRAGDRGRGRGRGRAATRSPAVEQSLQASHSIMKRVTS